MDENIKEALKSVYESLTDEQKEKAKACKDMDEFMKLAGEWGIEMPDELVDNVAGGRTKWFWECDKSHLYDYKQCIEFFYYLFG